jgi:AcrR family transcriptional regulator
VLDPRKSPLQARSIASVDAMLQATIQVLLRHGKQRFTTTLVAARAGVSVGTLYQYFPNKSALLQAALRRHLEFITCEVQRVCLEQQGKPLRDMVTALVTTFLAAKMRDPKASTAFYSISADVDGAKISQQMSVRSSSAIVDMLASSPEPLATHPETVAFMLQSLMVGVSRRILELPSPDTRLDTVRHELIAAALAYIGVCTKPRP